MVILVVLVILGIPVIPGVSIILGLSLMLGVSIILGVLVQIFRQETPPGSGLDRTYLIKELDSTCVIAHQREAPTDTIELMTWADG